MSSNSVCAVVVTFHPDADVREHLSAVRTQVGGLVVVDNGSSQVELEALRAACLGLDAELIENGDNLGIATALNVGVRRAIAQGFEFVLLFDQDSEVTDGFVAAMLAQFERLEASSRVGILVPRYLDLRHGTEIPADSSGGEDLEVAMTSGSLIRTATFASEGLFADELFIDAVDHEYSLRLRQRGYRIVECREAVLRHSPGTPKVHRVMGWRYETANYSPVRRYYQERNKIWLAQRYFRAFPRYCAKLMVVSVKDLAKILFHEADKAKKVRYFVRGIWDGLRGRVGRFEGS